MATQITIYDGIMTDVRVLLPEFDGDFFLITVHDKVYDNEVGRMPLSLEDIDELHRIAHSSREKELRVNADSELH